MSVTATSEHPTMKIYVNRIPEEGLQERATYNPSTMDMERDDIHLRRPYEVNARITKIERELVVSAQITCQIELTCARCLEEFPQTIHPHGVFSYPVGATDVVDITEDIRQEVILAYPMIPVCRQDCKGLCSACGQNLNLATCRHHAS